MNHRDHQSSAVYDWFLSRQILHEEVQPKRPNFGKGGEGGVHTSTRACPKPDVKTSQVQQYDILLARIKKENLLLISKATRSFFFNVK